MHGCRVFHGLGFEMEMTIAKSLSRRCGRRVGRPLEAEISAAQVSIANRTFM
jgi:hypothetical protein